MQIKAEQLARRRQELIARCEAQRSAMAMHTRSLSHTASALDSALGILGRIRRHPGWIVGLVVAIIAIKPRRLSAIFHGSATALRTLRTVAPLVQILRARH